MQEQTYGIAGLATLEAAQPPDWQAEAVGDYEQSLQIRHAELRTDLSARILALTGQRISTQEIYTDGHLAVAGVDGASLRLYHGGDLVLVRSCAYCATGHFESPEITSLSISGTRFLPGDLCTKTARTIPQKSSQTFEQGDACHVDRREQGAE